MQAKRAVVSVIAEIQNEVLAGHKVTLSGFGTFEKVTRRARQGRNPYTGEPVAVPKRAVARFRLGKNFKDALNSPRHGEDKLKKTTKKKTKKVKAAGKAKAKRTPAKTAVAKRAPAKKAASSIKPGSKKVARKVAKKKKATGRIGRPPAKKSKS